VTAAAATRVDPRTVLHTMQDWLPLSEQFVYGVVAGSRHRAVVFSRRTPQHRDAFPFKPVYSAGRLLPPPRPFTDTERRAITAYLVAIGARHHVRLVHHHHGYRILDAKGLAFRRSIPWVVSLHGHDIITHAASEPGAYADALRFVDAIVVPSQWLAERAVASGTGVRSERVHVIPSGVDTAFFTPSPLPCDGPPEVLFVGRFVEKKGIDVLLAAWPAVRAAVAGARLRLLGFGPLESLARSGGEGVEVEPARATGRADQLRGALVRASAVVTPSRTAADGDAETLLLVNLEAQACGRPVVTTRHGGIPEFVADGESALVVPEADPVALADALVTVLRDRSVAERMAAAGPAVAARFDRAACTARVDDLYDDLLASGPLAR
jgi:glycosyltransferase involved in cell wall biosynthesis